MSDDILWPQTLQLHCLSYLTMSPGVLKATPFFHSQFYNSWFYSWVVVSRGPCTFCSWALCLFSVTSLFSYNASALLVITFMLPWRHSTWCPLKYWIDAVFSSMSSIGNNSVLLSAVSLVQFEANWLTTFCVFYISIFPIVIFCNSTDLVPFIPLATAISACSTILFGVKSCLGAIYNFVDPPLMTSSHLVTVTINISGLFPHSRISEVGDCPHCCRNSCCYLKSTLFNAKEMTLHIVKDCYPQW